MVLSRPLLIFVVAMWLILAILEWKDNFFKNPATNKWTVVDGFFTLVPDSPRLVKRKRKQLFQLMESNLTESIDAHVRAIPFIFPLIGLCFGRFMMCKQC